MSNLVLDSLEIKNFRAFQHLQIEKLGRVNLIVGKNNVGKTSVLEALMLYASKGDPYIVFQLLRERGEIANERYNNTHQNRNAEEVESRLLALSHLFHGRDEVNFRSKPARIGPISLNEDALLISIGWPAPQKTSEGEVEVVGYKVPRLDVSVNKSSASGFPLDQNYMSNLARMRRNVQTPHYIYVKAGGLNPTEVGTLWDTIALTDLENGVLSALKLIAPEVQALNLVGEEGPRGERTPKVRMPNVSRPIPLRSLGEGMNRMLGIALALVNAKDGMLLIDEVDTGLHYSVLPEMWKLIFEVAHRLNVQVFATSHSWDCIQAFQEAAAENKEAEGVLIRLEQRKDGIGAVTFDEDELAIVTREQIEVR